MDEDFENETGPDRRKRLVGRLDKMVESGRVTEGEARRLRAARGAGRFDEVVRDIRVRHATARTAAAVADGSMSQDEADGLLERLRNGEHSRSLRSHLAKLRPRGRSGRPGPGAAHRSDSEEDPGSLVT